VLATWDDPALGGPLKALVTAAMQDPTVLRALREYVEREVIAQLAERIGGPDATARASTFVVTIAGAIFTRYLLGLEPIASMPAAELTRRLVGQRPSSSAAQNRIHRRT
jgi:hypothetical protein